MNKIYLVTEWVVEANNGQPNPSFVVGANATLQGAQDRLKAAIVELVETYPDKAPFATCEDTGDICLRDNEGTLYHYNIIERDLGE